MEQCPFCELDTAGQHQYGCPLWQPLSHGRVCPKCGCVVWEKHGHYCMTENQTTPKITYVWKTVCPVGHGGAS